MKSANPVDDPFGSYADSVRESADGEPTPEAVWDEYAGNHDADDVLCLGTDPSLVGTVSLVDQSRPSETDTPSVTESHAATIRDEATVERGEK